jgi:TolB-like protein/DNA-binding winged helix-turn-helix (wHTH) protein
MLYRFGPFELDMAKVELREGGAVRPLERQVFALLALLVENRERLVSKDEIIEKVWEGRIVSESAVSSRVKSIRKALGDDGQTQRYIRTIHRQGFRFVADVTARHDEPARTTATEAAIHESAASPAIARDATSIVSVAIDGTECTENEALAPLRADLLSHPSSAPLQIDVSSHSSSAPLRADASSRPSIAVLPFRLMGEAGPYAAIAEALPHELITELARLRWLFVTARGSSFRLRPWETDLGEIGRLLGVRYCLSGAVEVAGTRLAVTVELADTRDGGIVWADRFAVSIDDVHQVREEIRSRVLTALEIHIPLHEAALARLTVTESLDAWSAYHLGLQHLYRFNRKDNAAATALFTQAITRDPGFARAHAGLSFVHFQTAFLRNTDDLPGEIALARRFAERGLELDPVDPFVNFTMGRSYWLEGDLDASLPWLDRSITVSPNYAQGIYARAWTETLAGRGLDGRAHVDLAMRLSPLDPLYYAMLGTRAFTHMQLGEDAEAAFWAEQAASSLGAHVLIAMIAAAAHGLNGDVARATYWAANARARNPELTRTDFFRSFPIKSEAMKARLSDVLARFGF